MSREYDVIYDTISLQNKQIKVKFDPKNQEVNIYIYFKSHRTNFNLTKDQFLSMFAAYNKAIRDSREAANPATET